MFINRFVAGSSLFVAIANCIIFLTMFILGTHSSVSVYDFPLTAKERFPLLVQSSGSHLLRNVSHFVQQKRKCFTVSSAILYSHYLVSAALIL